MNQWNLVETLTSDGASVVGHGPLVRGWTSLTRLNPAADISIPTLVDEVRATKRAVCVDARSTKARKTFHLEALPVLGPSGETHGVQVWIGDDATAVTAPRVVSGIAWLLERSVIAQTLEASMMSGVRPEDHVPERTPAEYYGKAAKFDDSEGLFALAFNPQAGARWDSEMSVDHADGHTMKWWCWGKARVDPGNVGARLLWHDISDGGEPAVPTFAEIAMQRGLAAAGIYTAAFDVDTAMLVMWLPRQSPAPWVRWRDIDAGNAVIHPDDRDVLVRAAAQLDKDREGGGQAAEVVETVRLRGTHANWVETVLHISKHPGPMSDRIALVRMSLPK